MLPADKMSLYFPSIKIFRIFCQKEKDLLPVFHKMLEGLGQIIVDSQINKILHSKLYLKNHNTKQLSAQLRTFSHFLSYV